MTRLGKVSLIIVAPGVVAVLIGIGAFHPRRPEKVSSKAVSFDDSEPDLLAKRSVQLAGPRAVDCEALALRADPTKGNKLRPQG